MNRFSKFNQLPTIEKVLFLEAVFFLFASKIFLFLPFRFCTKILIPLSSFDESADILLIKRVSSAVSRANQFAFWKNICLVKSFAARMMLQRRKIGSLLSLGLQIKNGKELVAHAWLKSGEYYVTPKGKTHYKEVFSI